MYSKAFRLLGVPIMCAKMRNDDMAKYLYLRSDGRSKNWHVRLTAPQEIHHLLPEGEQQVRKSTGTPDRTKAKAIAARIEAEYRQKWEALRQTLRDVTKSIGLTTTGLTESLISQICGARLESWSFTDDFDRIEQGLDEEDIQDIDAFCQLSDAAMRSILAQGKRSSQWEQVVERVLDWCEDLEYLIEPTDPLFPQLVRRFAETERKANNIIAQRNQGEFVPFPQPEVASATLSAMLGAYTSHKEASSGRKTLTTNLSIWQRFIDFCGDLPLDSITSNHIYRFIEDRLQSKNDPWSQNYATSRAKNTLKEFFGLARTLDLMTVANPVASLEITPKLSAEEAEKRKKPRFPYSSDHLNSLFQSAWYRPRSSEFRGKMRQDLAARYWAPLICLFHGLRVREVVQLHSHDMGISEGVLLMSIQLDLSEAESSQGPKRSLKNESTKRTVPVHPELIKLGFAEFVDSVRQRHAAGAPLFPSAVPNPTDKSPIWGRSYEQSFLRHARERLGFGHGYGNHSFRHAIEDKIRDVQLLHGVWPAGLAQFYTGRKLPRDSDKMFFRLQSSEIDYGKGYNPSHMLEHIQRIQYADVTLPPPFTAWLDGADTTDPKLLRAVQRQWAAQAATKQTPSKRTRSA